MIMPWYRPGPDARGYLVIFIRKIAWKLINLAHRINKDGMVVSETEDYVVRKIHER